MIFIERSKLHSKFLNLKIFKILTSQTQWKYFRELEKFYSIWCSLSNISMVVLLLVSISLLFGAYYMRRENKERVEWNGKGCPQEAGIAVKTFRKVLNWFVCSSKLFRRIIKGLWISSLSSSLLMIWHLESLFILQSLAHLFWFVEPENQYPLRIAAPRRTWLQHHFRSNEWDLNGRRLVYDPSFFD